MNLPLSSIIIGDRQRIDLGDITKLAESLRDNGQISDILVKPEGDKWLLVAGRRRLAAATQLGWTSIRAVARVTLDGKDIPVADLTPLQLQILEYEEDVRRKDRDWKELCLAVARLHLAKQLEHGFAPQRGGRSDNAWTERKMADFTGFDRSQVHYMLAIAKELQREPRSAIHECKNYSDAFAFLTRRAEEEVNREIERRRQNANKPPSIEVNEGDPSGNAESSSITEEAAPDRVRIYIHGINKPYADCKPDVDFMTEGASCILGHCLENDVIENVTLALRPLGFAVLWNWQRDYTHPRALARMPGTVLWNKVKIFDNHIWPYAQAYVTGAVFTRTAPTTPWTNPTNCIIACVPEELDARLGVGELLPPAVVDFSISPFTNDGMAVECIGGVNPVHVAELGRVPIFYEPNKAKFEATCEALKTFYESTIPGAEVILR